MPVIPALEKTRQEDQEFEASLDYKVKLCLKNQPKMPAVVTLCRPIREKHVALFVGGLKLFRQRSV
jgi:hypothetical protein